MPVLREPTVTIDDLRIRSFSLSRLGLDVVIRVVNPNFFGVTVEELPFRITCRTGEGETEIAAGTVNHVRIARSSETTVTVPVATDNAGFIRAIAAFLTQGAIPVTVTGVATIDCFVTSWCFPFTRSLTVTPEMVVDLAARK